MSSVSVSTFLPDEARHNFYYVIHKGLRFGHCRLLAAIGSTDFGDGAAVKELAADLRGFLGLARSHLEGENREIHAALEERMPGASAHAAEDHGAHERSFAELEDLIAALETATDKRAAGRALYRRFVLFMAHDLEHMHEEETELLATLHRAFSDGELLAIEGRIVAAIAPEKMAAYMKIMLPALSHPERLEFLGKLKMAMPEPLFAGFFANVVRAALPPHDFARLPETLTPRRAA